MSIASIGKERKVLVTGATGFLGSRLVKEMVGKHYSVRALVRKTSKIDQFKKLHVEIFYGDVADKASLEPAFSGVNVVVHAAADTRGNVIESKRTTVDGTKNIVELTMQHKIDKLIYISSCSVYGISECRPEQVVDEKGLVERYPEKRGSYSEAKIKAEALLLSFARENNIPFVCLRPGTILGEGGDIFTPMMGFSFRKKLFAIIGNGKFILPLVCIDNLVDAIILALESKNSTRHIYNVVNFDQVTKKEYVNILLRKLYPKAIFLYVPYSFIYIIVLIQEVIFGLLKRQPLVSRYRLTSSQRSVTYDSSKIKKELNWNPVTTLHAAIGKVLALELARANDKLQNKDKG